MSNRHKALLPVLILALVLSLGSMIACGGGGAGQTQTAVESNDSIVTCKLVIARVSQAGFPWEMDIEIYTSNDVSGFANLTKDKIGKVITVQTAQYPEGFGIGQGLTCHVRLEKGKQGSYYYAWDIH
jgi:hypothetical protein